MHKLQIGAIIYEIKKVGYSTKYLEWEVIDKGASVLAIRRTDGSEGNKVRLIERDCLESDLWYFQSTDLVEMKEE